MSTPDFNWFAITPTGPHTAPGANDRGWRLEVTMRRTPRVVSVHPMGSHLSLPTRGHKWLPVDRANSLRNKVGRWGARW